MNGSRNRPRPTVGPRLACSFGIRRKFAARIHGEGNAVKTRMESHFPDSDVKLVTAPDFRNGTGGFARVSQRSAARSRPLGIAELLRFLKPGCGLEQSEMRDAAWRQREQQAAAKQNGERSHVISPFSNPLESARGRSEALHLRAPRGGS